MKRSAHRSALLGALVLCLSSTATLAQQVSRPFPLDLASRDEALNGLVFSPKLDAITELLALDRVQLTGMPLFEGGSIDVALTRIDLDRLGFGFRVDDEERPDLLDGLDLSVWKGTVVGEPDSEVLLSFSNSGSRGWIRRDGDVLHLIGRPDEGGSWINGDLVAVNERTLGALGLSIGPFCASDTRSPGPADNRPTPFGGSTEPLGSGCGLKECTVAVETDFQLHEVFGDLGSMTSYITTLLAAISDRYEGQIGTILTFPYLQFYTDAADPWATPEMAGQSGVSQGTLLDEFVNAWQGNIPTGATLGHFISGAALGGGVAYLDVLCVPDFAFGVSANIGGNVAFPVMQQSGNWDFMVIAHEMGHNFSAPHTHDFCPPLDECPPSQYFGQCQTQQVCTDQGTLMSYCHLCDGGTANITTFFHPSNVALMTNAAQTCLPDFQGSIQGEDLLLVSETGTTAVSAQITGTPTSNVDLLYRYDGGAFQTIAMTDQGGGMYTADLPAAGCGDSPEYYFTFVDATCGVVVDPPGAPSETYGALVGSFITVSLEDFETTPGWVAVNLGATSGDWQAGVPVDDPGWDYDPASDADGSGSAYLTQNEVGNTDVDNGSVELTSPDLDMSGAGSALRYSYFFRNTNNGSLTDALVVEMNTNGGAGAWTEIARHDVDQGLSWTEHFISATDLAGLGLTPTANTRLRFTANDGDPQGIVEAGIDALEVIALSCDGGSGGPGTPFCFGTGCPCGNDDAGAGCVNSTGSGAVLTATGSTSWSADDLVLTTTGCPPNNNGLYFMGSSTSAPVFVGDGVACTGGLFRYFPGAANASGVFTQTTPVASAFAGAINVGDTRYFQSWTRDVLCGPPPAPCASPCGMNSNLSNGYSVTFTP